ncbi:MAG: hypothetical protein SVK08_08640, partial [Halobacteriota archaeon]|nr:hypothetical protein [Halobacteriota archaeon]
IRAARIPTLSSNISLDIKYTGNTVNAPKKTGKRAPIDSIVIDTNKQGLLTGTPGRGPRHG